MAGTVALGLGVRVLGSGSRCPGSEVWVLGSEVWDWAPLFQVDLTISAILGAGSDHRFRGETAAVQFTLHCIRHNKLV